MWPAAETLFTRLAEQANALALIEGERRLTAAEVLSEVQARSQRLLQLGARRVALALDNGIEWALWDLAILHAGLVCVPLRRKLWGRRSTTAAGCRSVQLVREPGGRELRVKNAPAVSRDHGPRRWGAR